MTVFHRERPTNTELESQIIKRHEWIKLLHSVAFKVNLDFKDEPGAKFSNLHFTEQAKHPTTGPESFAKVLKTILASFEIFHWSSSSLLLIIFFGYCSFQYVTLVSLLISPVLNVSDPPGSERTFNILTRCPASSRPCCSKAA